MCIRDRSLIIDETTSEERCDFALAPSVTFIASARSLRQRTLSVISDLTVESGGDVSAVNTNSLLFNFFSKLLLIKSYSFYIFCIWITN